MKLYRNLSEEIIKVVMNREKCWLGVTGREWELKLVL